MPYLNIIFKILIYGLYIHSMVGYICLATDFNSFYYQNFKLLLKYKKTIGFCVFWALIFSVPWDFWAIKTNIWMFPKETNLGILIGGLPLEEYLFIVFVTILISCFTLILKNKLREKRGAV